MNQVEEAVAYLAEAENIRSIYEQVEMTNSNLKKQILQDMLDLRKRMQSVMGVETSEKFADKFSFHYRYICDALFIEGKISQPY